MSNFAQLAAGDGTIFLVRWRGRQEGPYAGPTIQAKLEANEIGLLHEVYYEGKWVTIRDYIAEREAILRAQNKISEMPEPQPERPATYRVEIRPKAPPPDESIEVEAAVESEPRPLARAAQSADIRPPLCRTCEIGRLARRSQYRLSLPVVVIGYFFLAPSVIGMILSAIGLVNSLIHGVGNISHDPAKETAVAGTIFGTGFFTLLLVLSFVMGALGWLMVMKKQVLQCTHCGAVVPAS